MMIYTTENLSILDNVINHNKNGYILLDKLDSSYTITKISKGLEHLFKSLDQVINKPLSVLPEINEVLAINNTLEQFELSNFTIHNYLLNPFYYNISFQRKGNQVLVYFEDITKAQLIKGFDQSIFKIIKRNNEIKDNPELLLQLCFDELNKHMGLDFLVLNITEKKQEKLMYYELSKKYKAYRTIIEDQGFSMHLGNNTFIHHEKYTTYNNVKIDLGNKELDFNLMLQSPIVYKGTKLGSLWMVWDKRDHQHFSSLENKLIETVIQQFKVLGDRMSLNQEVFSKKEYFKSLIHQSHDIIATLNNQGEITYISPSVFKSLGFHDNDVIGQNIINYLDHHSFIEVHTRMIRALNKHGIFQEVIGVKNKSGFTRKFFFTIKKANEYSNISELIVNAKDVTTEHNSQHELLLHTKTNLLIQSLDKKRLNQKNLVPILQEFIANTKKEFNISFLGISVRKDQNDIWEHISDDLYIPNINEEQLFLYKEDEENTVTIKENNMRNLSIWEKYPLKSYLNKMYYEIPLFCNNKRKGVIHFCINPYGEYHKNITNHFKEIAIQLSKSFEQLNINETLRHKEELNRAILGSIPNMILIIREDGYIENFHHAPQNDYKVPKEAFLFKNAFDIIDQSKIYSERDAIQKCLTSRQRVVSQFDFDNKIIESFYTYYAPNKVVAIFKDVTIQKNREIVELKKIMQALDIERNRFSRELHDGIGQILTAVRMNVEAMKYNYENDDAAHEQADFITNLLNQAIAETRNIVFNLHPRTLYDLGLKNALSEVVQMLSNQSNTTNVKFDFQELKSVRFSEDLELGAFRLCQELLNNGIKYAQASLIELKIYNDKQFIYINYFDNGVGFNINQILQKKSNGLINMKNRVSSLSGIMDIKTQEGEGCMCKIKLPIPSRELNLTETYPQRITSTF